MNTRPHPLSALTTPVSVSLAFSPYQASIYPSASQLPTTKPRASTASDLLRQAALSTQPTHDSPVPVLQKDRADLTEALNSHRTALSSSKYALGEKNIACSAMVSSLSAFEKQVKHLRVGNDSLKEVNQELRQKIFPLLRTPQARNSTDSSQSFPPVCSDSLER